MKNFLTTTSENGYLEASKYLGLVFCFYCVGGILLFSNAGKYPQMLGMAVLAYTFGLQHAFDVDHIAAIDNMSRKLIQQGKKTKGVGFFFSFGHSLTVIILSVITIFAVKWAKTAIPQFNSIGGVVATLVSGCFLLLLALVNFIMLKEILITFKRMRHGEAQDEVINKGRIGAIINHLVNIVNKNYHIVIVGFLFGVGFDTPTQVAVLATSATAVAQGVPLIVILCLPLLFTAGMTTMDTLDGIFMSTAYKWVFSSPLRKVYYNLTITGLSIVAAGIIGIIEVFQVIAMERNLNSGFWMWLQNLDFNIMGRILVVIFIVVWSVSFIGWKVFRLGDKEADYTSL
jgi:high-affinity nickel-transport protein